MDKFADEIADFQGFLTAAGLECVRHEEPADAMGYILIEFVGHSVHVRLIREKGWWTISMSSASWATSKWYVIADFCFLVEKIFRPALTITEQIKFAEDNWLKVRTVLEPDPPARAGFLLEASKIERHRRMFAVWPTAVLRLEAFLEKKALKCEFRKEPSFLYDYMSILYCNVNIAIRVDSECGWRMYFADPAHAPWRWYKFSTIRQRINPAYKKTLSFEEQFIYVEDNWLVIEGLFRTVKYVDLHDALVALEREAETS